MREIEKICEKLKNKKENKTKNHGKPGKWGIVNECIKKYKRPIDNKCKKFRQTIEFVKQIGEAISRYKKELKINSK